MVTVGAATLAAATGRVAFGIAAVALTVGASQLAIGWHNDWLDAPRDAIAGRIDKPVASGEISRALVAGAAVMAGLLTIVFGLLSGPKAALIAAVGLGSGLAYNWPLKTVAASVLPYLVSFAVLPTFVVLGLPGAPWPPAWLVAAGACLGGGAHFANVLSDLDDDARTGVRGLPHRIGLAWSTAAAGGLLMVTSLLLVFGPVGPPTTVAWSGLGAVCAILLAGAVAQIRWPRSRIAFRTVLAAALLDVALLLAAGSLV